MARVRKPWQKKKTKINIIQYGTKPLVYGLLLKPIFGPADRSFGIMQKRKKNNSNV